MNNLTSLFVKKCIALLIFFGFINLQNVQSQTIYGFVDNMFCSTDLSDSSIDTLIVFSEDIVIDLNQPSAIDRFNGRYFFGGRLPGHNGQLHSIDLVDLSIESYGFYPKNFEYDFIRNRIVYEASGRIYERNLSTSSGGLLGVAESSNSTTIGQNRTYIAQTNQFLYSDYINGSSGDSYYLLIDTDSFHIVCQEVIETGNLWQRHMGGIVTNNLNGDIIGHHNGQFGIINPCDGTSSKLLQIPDYHSHLNQQMSMYNHNDSTYIIPYVSRSGLYKIAIVDVYNNQIKTLMSQPWDGKMNLQQIYDQPVASLIYSKNTLYVPKGISYKWFLNDELIGTTSENYWVPTEDGIYKAEVEFREYSTFSTEQNIVVEKRNDIEPTTTLNIYPNPTSNILNIDLTDTDLTVITISNLNGQELYNLPTEGELNIEINIENLPNGIYYLTIKTDKEYTTQLISKF